MADSKDGMEDPKDLPYGSENERKISASNVDLDNGNALSIRTPLVPLVDEKDDYIVLGRSSSAHKKWRRKGLLEIGAVGEHQDTGIDLFGRKVYLDAAFPHIAFICGKRGSGKSYTLGIFAEELMRSAIGVGVIMIDPIGIFWSLKEENRSRGEKKILKQWGLEPHSFPEVKVLVPEGSRGQTSGATDGLFSIGVGEMAADDWCQVFDVDRFKTQGLLIGSAVEMVRNGYDSVNEGRIVHIPGRESTYSIGDIVQCIETSIVLTSKTGGFTTQTRRSIIARFNAAAGWGIFSVEGTPLREITSSNRVTVLDVSDPRLGDEKRSLITGVIARKVLSARIHSARIEEREDFDEMDPDLIPVTWLLIDEAHIILPHNRQTPATEALVEYAKQGRRPGCALVLATQRPASTSDEILSQVDLLIGHNLALEDDMTALRRRVPAKLPSEFANSDFIRAISVGTAIMADQRTQQRSFLMRVRPRFSHHAGSSAMPKAFIERRENTPKHVAVSGSYNETRDPVKVKDPTPLPVDAAGQEKETNNKSETYLPGTSIMVRDGSKEMMVGVLDSFPEGVECLLFSRMPTEHYPIGSSLIIETSFWLSSTTGTGVIDPTSLQDISMEAESFLEEHVGGCIVLDGMDFLVANNGRDPVKKLLEVLHEKVIVAKGTLVFRLDTSMDDEMVEVFSAESDRIFQQKDDLSVTKEDVSPKKVQEGSLNRTDLEWMCDVLGVSKEGSDSMLLERIMEQGEKENTTKQPEVEKEDHLRSMMETARNARKENERLLKRIDNLESKLKRRSSGKRKKKRGMVLEWEDEEKRKDQDIRSLAREVETVKKEMEVKRKQDSPGTDPALIEILDRMEKERSRNIERLKIMEDVLKDELKDIRKGLKERSPSSELPPARDQLPPKGGSGSITPKTSERRVGKPRKKVLKKGKRAVIVRPKVGRRAALESARKTLKRSFLRGPREKVERISPMYIPLYRFFIEYKAMIFGGRKEGDLYIDGITGEVICGDRGDLDRSKGLKRLLKMTDLETRVYKGIGSGKKEDLQISRKASLTLKETRRALTSLKKKGIVDMKTIEGDIKLYSVSDDINIPRRTWCKDPEMVPKDMEGIEDPFLPPSIKEKEALRLVNLLSEDLGIIQKDMVMYPIYVAIISGEGRERFVAVDAVSGKVDETLAPFLPEVLSSLSSK